MAVDKTYEIQRVSNDGWRMACGRIGDVDRAVEEVKIMLAHNPSQRLRIVERTERVVLMSDKPEQTAVQI